MSNTNKLYSAHMKLADMISEDPELLSILERLGIRLGFGDADIDEVCGKYGQSTGLFLMICNIYSFEDYVPDISVLGRSDLPLLVSYLRASHRYYTDFFFPRLHASIHEMVRDCDEINRSVINGFYDSYDTEVSNHFEYEEDVVFPYVEKLAETGGNSADGYNIDQFERNHSNIDEKLNDFKNIVIKYIPESSSNKVRFEVANNICKIERDLKKHTFVENRILIPLVSKLEHDE